MSLTNTQYDTILHQYEMKQLKSRREAERRLACVYDRIPRYRELEDRVAAVSVAQGKKLLAGDEEAMEDLRDSLAELSGRKAQLLEDAGFAPDYLEPVYECPDCKDTGYIGGRKCHCFEQAAIDLVYTQSNIRRILDVENFAHFSYDYYSDKQINPATGLSSLATARQAVQDCKEFVRTFDTEFHNLFFYGDTGIGKTYLSNCVAKELLDSSHSVIYFTAPSLFHIFERNAFGKLPDTEEDYGRILECDLLIIDDLGTELTNTFTVSQLFLCLNERILRQKSTIISTNLGLGQLADTYSERTFSRISSSYTIIKLFGNDIRIQKKLNGQPCQDT